MIKTILTHLAYRANCKKRVISNNIVTVLKGRGKRALADVNDLHIHVNVSDTVQLQAGLLQCNGIDQSLHVMPVHTTGHIQLNVNL